MTIDKLFDSAAKARIAAAVQEAEARTVGQIVPVVVARARDYHGFLRALGTLLLGLVAALAVAIWVKPLPVDPEVLLLLLTLGIGLAALPALERAFVRRDFDAAVRLRAQAAFVQHAVHETREGTGVLIFASLYERRVVILGDRAIHQKVGDPGWQAAVEVLAKALAQGDPASGFCEAIARIGDTLAKEFPRTDDGRGNELSDELRVER